MTTTEAAKYSPEAQEKYDLVGKTEMVGLFNQLGRALACSEKELYCGGDSTPCDLSDIGLNDVVFEAETRDKNERKLPPWGESGDPNHPYYLRYQDVSVTGRKAKNSTAFLHFSVDYVTRLNCNIVLMSDARNKKCWAPFHADSNWHEGEDFRASITLDRAIVFHRKTLTSLWEPCHHPACEKITEDGYSLSSLTLQKIARVQY